MVEIDPWKCLPDPLTFLADGTILGRLGCSVQPTLDGAHLEQPPIREGAPQAKEATLVHAEKIACRVTEGTTVPAFLGTVIEAAWSHIKDGEFMDFVGEAAVGRQTRVKMLRFRLNREKRREAN
jgi:hypothetical protein